MRGRSKIKSKCRLRGRESAIGVAKNGAGAEKGPISMSNFHRFSKKNKKMKKTKEQPPPRARKCDRGRKKRRGGRRRRGGRKCMVFHDFPCVFKIRTCTNCDRGRIFEAPGREGTKNMRFASTKTKKKKKRARRLDGSHGTKQPDLDLIAFPRPQARR